MDLNIGWQSPANIALIKYWGKHGRQLPGNPSLSMTLKESVSTTWLNISEPAGDTPVRKFLFEGQEKPEFAERVFKYLDSIADDFPFLNEFNISIDSHNNFPHSSGISSSASFMSSLALCVANADSIIKGEVIDDENFMQKVSNYARLGSGSAARSVYGNYVLWGETELLDGSSDQYAVPLLEDIHPVFNEWYDAVLVVNSGKKPLSSTAGHALMNDNPYAEVRYEKARKNLQKLMLAMKTGDVESFIDIVEDEALSLHAMIMSSEGGPILMDPQTLCIIKQVRAFREENGIPVCFTLDAGPNIHLLYSPDSREIVEQFIYEDLQYHCEAGKWLDDMAGSGPNEISND